MIDTRLVGYNHLISNKREWNNCFIKNNQEILLDLADFDLMVSIFWAWYNGLYIMAAKPIKSLELHYTMTQFLINTLYPPLSNHKKIVNYILLGKGGKTASLVSFTLPRLDLLANINF